MKFRFLLFSFFCFLSVFSIKAQETTTLSLEEAVQMALVNSDASKIADAKITTAESQLNVTKNNQYPDLDISGQYLYLANADVEVNATTGASEEESEPAPQPDVNYLLLGRASVSVPVFSGFKLKNLIKSDENNVKAATYNAKNEKEQIAIQTIVDYINLYKATKTVALLKENLNATAQRVTDFTAMEENGLLARNDLLKVQLQQSNVSLLLEEAIKNRNILNYKLAVTLKLPENTNITTNEFNSGIIITENLSEEILRNDLEAVRFQEKAAEAQIKVAKSNYYPSLALTGGYIALDLDNTITVKNAINVGVGVSYNLANIFKNKSDVKLAKSRVSELQYTLDLVSDKVKVEVENAKQEYELTLRKYEVYTQSEEQAGENYRIVKDKYDNGLVDTNDLLEADVQQLQAKLDVAYGKADITQKYYELLTAKGTVTNQFNQN